MYDKCDDTGCCYYDTHHNPKYHTITYESDESNTDSDTYESSNIKPLYETYKQMFSFLSLLNCLISLEYIESYCCCVYDTHDTHDTYDTHDTCDTHQMNTHLYNNWYRKYINRITEKYQQNKSAIDSRECLKIWIDYKKLESQDRYDIKPTNGYCF